MSNILDTLKSVLAKIAPTIAASLGGPLAGSAVSFLADKLIGDVDASPIDIIAAIKANSESSIRLKEIDNQFKLELAKLDQAVKMSEFDLNKQQIEVNKIEATRGDLFKSSWRPLAAYVCIAGLINNYLIFPYLIAFDIHVPMLDLSELLPILFGLLGLGAYRSIEKIKLK